MARARKFAAPGGVRSTTMFPEASAVTSSSPHSRASRASSTSWVIPGLRGALAALGRNGVHQHPVLAAHAHGAEFHQVAGKRGLVDLHAVVRQQSGKLRLRPHRQPGQQRTDACLPGRLGGGHAHAASSGIPVRPDRAISQTIRAFWACSRFSASSQTTDCGPSITSAEIS